MDVLGDDVRVLIVRLGSLGDIVHALPVAAALREADPRARLDWVVDARYSAVLDLVSVIDRRIVVEAGRGVRAWAAAIRDLRNERYDAAVDLQGLIKSAALARASGARRVIGFGVRHLRERAASVFYTERCEAGDARHVVDKNLAVLPAFGLQGAPRRFPITAPESAEAVVQAARLAVVEACGRSAFALINPGAAWPNKRWPPERFGTAAAWMAARHGLASLVLWGPGERELADRVARVAPGAAVAAPPTSVGDLVALAREARLMVSGDTGPLHLAAGVGTPIVALFGPTDPRRNGPWSAADISLSRYDECVCHYRRRCRRPTACIEELTVEDVCGAIDRRLAAGNPV